MKKLFLIIFLMASFLLSSCFNQNHYLKIESTQLTNNSKLNTNILFRSFAYGLHGEESEYALYDGESIETRALDTCTGVSDFVFLSNMDILYSFFDVDNKDDLTDKLGQYCYYRHYDDLTIYVFYNYYLGKPYTENLVIVKNGQLHHLIDTFEKDWMPIAVYREGDYFHIVSTEFNSYEYDQKQIKWKSIELNNLETRTCYVPIMNWESKGSLSHFFTFDDLCILQYSILKQNEITVFDSVSQKVLTQKSFPDNIQLSRDEQHMYLIDMKDSENLSVEITEVEPISFEPRTNSFSVSADIPQALSFSNAMIDPPFCKDGIIYLPLQNQTNPCIYYVLVIDTLNQEAASLITIDCIDRALDIRFLEDGKLLYDEKGTLS